MERSLLTVFVLAMPVIAGAAGFQSVQPEDGDSRLVITMSDKRRFDAPRQEGQDKFFAAKIAANAKYVGWEVGQSGLGASYSMPTSVVILDEANHLYSFSGEFGVIYNWCFSSSAEAVIFWYSFPHGTDMRQFEMRRIQDGHLLARYELPHEDRARTRAVKAAPRWVRCMPDWSR